MGKSPGKWIKTLVFGKKSSISKKMSAAKVPVSDLAVNSPVISDDLDESLNQSIIDGGGEKAEVENDTTNTNSFPSGTHDDVDSQLVLGTTVSTDDAELELQAQAAAAAATKTQAAIRGYLARRAFRGLKGIIQLQSVIRGHLVRRQAVSTLHCTWAIVRIQALARGRRVRLSDFGYRVRVLVKNSFREHKDVKPAEWSAMCISEKLATNAFVCKLLGVMPRAMPLSLVEPNSAWDWLERWSLSHFWKPLSRPNKSQTKHYCVGTEVGRLKRSGRKVVGTISNPNDVELKQVVANPQREPVQEQPENEYERVRRNLRKVSVAYERSEAADSEMEQPNPVEIPKSHVAVNYCKVVVESAGTLTLELSSKENQKTRRKSLAAKQKYTENISRKTQSLPGYMAATASASAKAKLKPQGAPISTDEDAAQNNGLPQIHQKVQTNGEGGTKSISSSRDDKVLQSGWRR